jgi:hypothetical protein
MIAVFHGDRRRQGATLIEVMVAALILATLAIAGGALLHRVRAMLYHERNLRVATDLAAGRLEELRGAPFAQLAPVDTTPHYPARSNDVWVLLASDPGETVTLNGRIFPVTTTLWLPEAGDALHVRARVEVAYGPEPDTRVRMDTRLAP